MGWSHIVWVDSGSLGAIVPNTWPACHEFESVPLKVRRVEGLKRVKSVGAQTSSHWCGVEVSRGGVSSGVIHVYGDTESSVPCCRAVEVDRDSIFCRTWSTSHRTRRLAPG
ncbi:hypothetical protein TNCV_2732981 [Trichonephila clavipes]|nr:hypothetical protein TNCV_2732981 [Trichonephila clavipes]